MPKDIEKPCSGIRPMPSRGASRDPHRSARLFRRQTGEESHFRQISAPLVLFCQLADGLVEGEEITVRGFNGDLYLVQIDSLNLATSL